MSVPEVSPEQLAKLFSPLLASVGTRLWMWGQCEHALVATCFTARTQPLIAAARLTLAELATSSREQEEKGRYLARPGEAEWGC